MWEVELRKIPYVDEVLRELKQRYKLGIITNTVTSHEQHVRMALKRIGLEKYFDVILTSVDAATINQTRKSFVRHLKH